MDTRGTAGRIAKALTRKRSVACRKNQLSDSTIIVNFLRKAIDKKNLIALHKFHEFANHQAGAWDCLF